MKPLAGPATAGTTAPVGDEPVCVCRDVSRAYGPRYAVRDVNATIDAGARIALVGQSGSGKSTLLHIIAGLETPSSGLVTWRLGGDPTSRRALIGVVFQAPSLLDPLTVIENVELPLLLDDVEPAIARERAGVALASLGLSDLAAQLPEELSGGQAQRVAAARVLAGRPRLILADEPTGQLDHATGDQVVTALSDTARLLGAALVIATHDPAVAARMDQRWSIADGRLAPIGAAQ